MSINNMTYAELAEAKKEVEKILKNLELKKPLHGKGKIDSINPRCAKAIQNDIESIDAVNEFLDNDLSDIELEAILSKC